MSSKSLSNKVNSANFKGANGAVPKWPSLPIQLCSSIATGLSAGIGYALTSYFLQQFVTAEKLTSSEKHFNGKEIISSCNQSIRGISSAIYSKIRELFPTLSRHWPLFIVIFGLHKQAQSDRIRNKHYSPLIMHTMPMICYVLFSNAKPGKGKPPLDDLDNRTENNDNNKPVLPSSEEKKALTTPDENEEQKRSRSNSIITQTDDSYAAADSTDTKPPPRYLEMLVHNVSHTDLVLCLGIPPEYRNGKGETLKENVESEENPGNQEDSGFTPRVTNRSNKKNSKEGSHVLCRPRFSAFDMFCRRLMDVVRNYEVDVDMQSLLSSIMSFPRYDRTDSNARFSLVTPRPSRQSMLPAGFNLSQLVSDDEKGKLNLDGIDLQSLRMRGKDVAKVEPLVNAGYIPSSTEHLAGDSPSDSEREKKKNKKEGILSSPLHLEAMYFPLLSSLLRRWHAQISNKYGNSNKRNVKKVLILVSGVGTPRNWTHSKSGNSTESCAELLELFIKVLYPDVTIVKLHSDREIFRYDENITFANRELMPCIDAYRDSHARGEKYPDEYSDEETISLSSDMNIHRFDPDWKQTFSVTLSFADGAPARTHAIQSALRPYRPTYFHFWQLKTFWHESKICDDDIEEHSFESMETVPAREIKETDSTVQMVVKEMKSFRQHFLSTIEKGNNDIQKFWLRKTRKPVLAVLLVHVPGRGPILYRGTNMEVSMPTGSLCAERNVIGTALATNPDLRREDLKMVAVLAIELREEKASQSTCQTPNPPPGVSTKICTSIGSKPKIFGKSDLLCSVEKKLAKFQKPENMRRSMSIGSFPSIVECDDNDDDESSWCIENINGGQQSSNQKVPPLPLHEINATSAPEEIAFSSNDGPQPPIRKIKLYTEGDSGIDTKPSIITRRRKIRTVLVRSAKDINPLKPCGACNEWLKKIAESNPAFKVITFTDADCNGIYILPCQE